MATYQPFATGYKPEFAYGAALAGENEAMQRQQNRISNLADLFDLRQKGITADTGEFDLSHKRLLQPSVLAEAGVKEREANLMTDETLRQKLAGEQADWRGKVRKEAFEQYMDPYKREGDVQGIREKTQASKQAEHIDALRNILPVLDSQGALAASAQISQIYAKEPEKRDAMLFAIQGGTKGVQNLLDHYAMTEQKSIQEMAKQRLINKGNLDVASEQGKKSLAAATRAANAAIISGEKNAITASIAVFKNNLDYLKIMNDSLLKDIESLKDDKKQSDKFKAKVEQQKTIQQQVNDSQDVLTKLAKSLTKTQTFNETTGKLESGLTEVDFNSLK